MNLIKRITDKLHGKSLLVNPVVNESIYTEVYFKNHGWQKLLSKGEFGTHEGISGIYYLVEGFGKVHEKYCIKFR